MRFLQATIRRAAKRLGNLSRCPNNAGVGELSEGLTALCLRLNSLPDGLVERSYQPVGAQGCRELCGLPCAALDAVGRARRSLLFE